MKTTKHLCFVAMLSMSSAISAQTAPPPVFGEETKGTPAIPETATQAQIEPTNGVAAPDAASDEKTPKSLTDTLLGEATITESRRESGQVYMIELEHSSGSKQYIEENDSDGELSSDDNDLDDTPNLSKWKLGSW